MYKEGDYVTCQITCKFSYPGRILKILKDNLFNVLVSVSDPSLDNSELVEFELSDYEISPIDISKYL